MIGILRRLATDLQKRKAPGPTLGCRPASRRPLSRAGQARDESGVALVLAIVFLTAISLLLLTLASATSGNLLTSSSLKSQRSLEYAADGATSLAVQSVRYSGNQYASPAACLPGGGPVAINGVSMYVTCSQQASTRSAA